MSPYTTLPEPVVSCSHLGKCSPILLRVEALSDVGSLTLTERVGQRPVIDIDGDLPAARSAFSYAIHALRYYLDHFEQDFPALGDDAPRFEIDIRRSDYRILLMHGQSEEFQNRILVFGSISFGAEHTRYNLREAVDRMTDVFGIFYSDYTPSYT